MSKIRNMYLNMETYSTRDIWRILNQYKDTLVDVNNDYKLDCLYALYVVSGGERKPKGYNINEFYTLVKFYYIQYDRISNMESNLVTDDSDNIDYALFGKRYIQKMIEEAHDTTVLISIKWSYNRYKIIDFKTETWQCDDKDIFARISYRVNNKWHKIEKRLRVEGESFLNGLLELLNSITYVIYRNITSGKKSLTQCDIVNM